MTRIEPIPEPTPIPSGAIYEAVDEFTVRRVKAVVVESVSTDFDLDFLYEQEIAITRQRDEMISAKTRELAEVKEAIREAEAAGVKRRPVAVEEPIV